MNIATRFPRTQPEHGHPLLALAAALLAIAAVGSTMLIGRSDGSVRSDGGVTTVISQSRAASYVQEVYYIVETPEQSEAILLAESQAVSDAVLMGGEPPTRNLHILMFQSVEDEMFTRAMLLETTEGAQIVDTRQQVPAFVERFAPLETPAAGEDEGRVD